MNTLDSKNTIEKVLKNIPTDWLKLTTHRLDIYHEELAKSEFVAAFEKAVSSNQFELTQLPTAYDYIRLGHPLSCVLEWALAKENNLDFKNVIAFASHTMPILAVLRRNLHLKKKTQIIATAALPGGFDESLLKSVYGYDFVLVKAPIENFEGSTICLSDFSKLWDEIEYDFNIYADEKLGSVIKVNEKNTDYIAEIQHVRRRESIAMTPQNCLTVLENFVGVNNTHKPLAIDPKDLIKKVEEITHTTNGALFGNCGLSVQYSIMMGLIQYANEHHAGKAIKFIVPPNCYGGTNDQARRVAANLSHVEILDLPVDGGNDMVQGVDKILDEVAQLDAVPFIIAEIPTNPRVEVPDLEKLNTALSKARGDALKPVFILDQTFCPNVKFFGTGDFLKDTQTIAYVSGSKFPSGGLCTAGYCVANDHASLYMPYVTKHLELSDNGATDLQVKILSAEMPSMLERIEAAYKNTRAFTDFIQKTLPNAKINFVPHELSDHGFTPSVFSLDLPTKGDTEEERENYKRELNHKLIKLMITEIPNEAKHCVSYGQLKGSYWTIPATSTQGTTKESDKDYIVRVSIAPDFDLEKHQEVFKEFVRQNF
jgi:cystathionine beta-lyase/cystathionine gamma-synthase